MDKSQAFAVDLNQKWMYRFVVYLQHFALLWKEEDWVPSFDVRIYAEDPLPQEHIFFKGSVVFLDGAGELVVR